MVRARQAVITEPFMTAVREVELADPAPNQILIAAEWSAISAGTELAVYTGKHQWLQDPNMPDWKFPFRSGYSAAGKVLKVGKDFPGGFKEGDRVSYPGNHASAELLTVGHERCRVWPLPEKLSFEKASTRVHFADTGWAFRCVPASPSAAAPRCWDWASSGSSRCGACSQPAPVRWSASTR